MSTRLIVGLLCCATACASEPDSPQGTYHLTITRRTPDASASRVPSTVSWPATADMTLRFDKAGHAQVALLGGEASVAVQKTVTNGRAGYSPPVEDGSLELELNLSSDLLVVDDLVACPQSSSAIHGSFFELFVLDGHVHGSTAGAVVCVLPDIPSEGFGFDVVGDRVAD